MNLMREMRKAAERTVEQDGRWLFFESAIVVENNDPERKHRIKVVIPSIDPDNRFDDWVRAGCGVCLGDGYGQVFIPEMGSEVLVSGVLGQKYNLVYHAPMYHEEWSMPSELDADTAGMKVPRNLSLIAELLAKLQAQNIQIIAAELAKVQSNQIQIVATEETRIVGGTVQIDSDGSVLVSGGTSIAVSSNGNVSISANGNLTLQSRLVNKTGPAI